MPRWSNTIRSRRRSAARSRPAYRPAPAVADSPGPPASTSSGGRRARRARWRLISRETSPGTVPDRSSGTASRVHPKPPPQRSKPSAASAGAALSSRTPATTPVAATSLGNRRHSVPSWPLDCAGRVVGSIFPPNPCRSRDSVARMRKPPASEPSTRQARGPATACIDCTPVSAATPSLADLGAQRLGQRPGPRVGHHQREVPPCSPGSESWTVVSRWHARPETRSGSRAFTRRPALSNLGRAGSLGIRTDPQQIEELKRALGTRDLERQVERIVPADPSVALNGLEEAFMAGFGLVMALSAVVFALALLVAVVGLRPEPGRRPSGGRSCRTARATPISGCPGGWRADRRGGGLHQKGGGSSSGAGAGTSTHTEAGALGRLAASMDTTVTQ